MDFHIFTEQEADLPWQQLAEIHALDVSLTVVDARMRARRKSGRRFATVSDRATADRMLQALVQAGVQGVVVAENEMIPNAPAEQIRNADPLQDGLEIEPLMGGKFLLPWSAFLLFTAGRVSRRKVRPRGMTFDLSSEESMVDLAPALADVVWEDFVVDFYTGVGATHYRISRKEFNFDCLGEDRAAGSAINFQRLLLDLRRRALAARSSQSFDSALAGLWQTMPLHVNFGAFDESNDWELLALRRSKTMERDSTEEA